MRLQSLPSSLTHQTLQRYKSCHCAAGDCQHAHAPRLQWLGHRDLLQRLQLTRTCAIPHSGLQVPQLQQLQHKEAQRRQDQCTVCSRLQQRSNSLIRLANIESTLLPDLIRDDIASSCQSGPFIVLCKIRVLCMMAVECSVCRQYLQKMGGLNIYWYEARGSPPSCI